MKKTGITLLLIGFIWIVFDCAPGFGAYQYARFIWRSKQLPQGENITRADGIRAMYELGLDLNAQHRKIIIPALLMLTGGLMASSGRLKNEQGPNAMDSI